MNNKIKLVKRMLILSLAFMFYVLSPFTVMGKTNEREEMEPGIVLGQTKQSIDIVKGLRLLEGMYLSGVEKDNNLIIDFADEVLTLSFELIDKLEDNDLLEQSTNNLDTSLIEATLLKEGTYFYTDNAKDTPQIEVVSEMEIPLQMDADGRLGLYLGELFYYLEEPSDQDKIVDDKDGTISTPEETEEIEDNLDEPSNNNSEEIVSDVQEVTETVSLEDEPSKTLPSPTPANLVQAVNPWDGVVASFFEPKESQVAVYDKSGSGERVVGLLVKGQVYPILKDEGDWLRIQFGNTYGYVSKEFTIPVKNGKLNNLNTNYKNLNRSLTATERIAVYDNSSGQLVPFGTIEKGTIYPIVSDFGSNWIRVIFADRVGYVYSGGASVGFTVADKYFKANSNLDVYDNRTGKLVKIGELTNDQVYQRVSDYGANWHQIQFGDHFGYVSKSGTSYDAGSKLRNLNTNYATTGRKFTASERIAVYDNTTGSLVRFGVIDKGAKYPITSDYAANWWRVIFGDRVGYIYKDATELEFTTSDKYFKANENVDVYDNRSGSLVKVGELTKDQVYERRSDYGANWHQIQFGSHYGYVYKASTSVSSGSGIRNKNTSYKTTGRTLKALNRVAVYDNTSGALVPFGTIDTGSMYPIASDYAANWWRVIFGDRVGYVTKDATKAAFDKGDKYFRAIESAPIYDNRTGSLVKVGETKRNQTYAISNDYGNWWQVQFGDIYGYVYKGSTGYATPIEISNINTKYKNSKDKIIAPKSVTVYEKSSGRYIPMGTLDGEIVYPIVNKANGWIKVLFLNRVGYIAEDSINLHGIKQTVYDLTFEEALNNQLKLNAQTDKKYSYVSKNYISNNTVTAETLNVRAGAGTSFDLVGHLNKGEKVNVLSEHGNWYVIEFNPLNYYYGYVSKDYVVDGMVTATSLNIRSEANTGSKILGQLKKGNKANIVGEEGDWYHIQWSTNRQWVNASPDDISYYLNPKNFEEDERQKFQFLDLSRATNTRVNVLNNFLSNKGILANQGQAFIDAANTHNINEIYLMSHSMLETGNGTSRLATGIKVNGVTVYNVYGVGAYDADPLKFGSEFAYEQGWTTPYKAIVGGASFIGNRYINAGLNTLYKMRWNPDRIKSSSGTLLQYATDIGWASKQVHTMYNIYQLIDYDTLFLDIPNYK